RPPLPVQKPLPSALLLKHGRVVATGPTRHVLARYLSDTESQPRKLAAISHRSGSGEIHFVDCSIFPTHDEQPSAIRSGDDFTVRLHFRCQRPVDKPSFSVALRSLVGVPIFAIHTADVGATFSRVEGDGFVDLEISRTNLMPGTYTLDFAAGVRVTPQ